LEAKVTCKRVDPGKGNQGEPMARVALTGREKSGYVEHRVTYSHDLPPCLIWLPDGFTPELLEDLIQDTRSTP
jgi:hypothetical protein